MCTSNLSVSRSDFNPHLDEDREPGLEMLWTCDRETIERFPVPGGWLYLTCLYSEKKPYGDPIFAMQSFVPVPGRAEWARCAREVAA